MNWNLNWVDWLIVIVLVLGLIDGFREGFVRLVIGFGALLVGFVAASWLNGLVAGYLQQWISNRPVAVVVAFVLIFWAVILLGALIASTIVRLFKLVGLTPVDRVMGAGFGAVRASLGLVIATMILMAFLPNQLPVPIRESTLAPYVIGASRTLASATPFEIRSGVEKAYASIRGQLDQLRPGKRIPAREE